MLGISGVVLRQDVVPKVAVEIAPDDVLVVGFVLCVVVLDEEGRALNPVVVRSTELVFRGANPGKPDVLGSSRLDRGKPGGRQIRLLRGRMRFDQASEQGTLLRVHITGAKAGVLEHG